MRYSPNRQCSKLPGASLPSRDFGARFRAAPASFDSMGCDAMRPGDELIFNPSRFMIQAGDLGSGRASSAGREQTGCDACFCILYKDGWSRFVEVDDVWNDPPRALLSQPFEASPLLSDFLGDYHQRAFAISTANTFFDHHCTSAHLLQSLLSSCLFDPIFNIHPRGLTYMRQIDTDPRPLNTNTHNERFGEQSKAPAATEAATSS